MYFQPVLTKCKSPKKQTRPDQTRGEYFQLSGYRCTRIIFFLSCRNIKFRGFRAEIFRSGGFVQKYWSVTAARYCYVLSMGAMFIERKSNGPLNHKIEGNTMYYMISCKFSEFPFELCRKRAFNRAKKALFFGVVQKYYHPATMGSWIPVQGHFQGLCRNRNFWRYIHLCLKGLKIKLGTFICENMSCLIIFDGFLPFLTL